MSLKLSSVRDGVLIPVRAKPRARKNAVEGVREGALLVSVTAAPEDGRANAAILKVLSKCLGCAPSTLAVERGATTRDKIVLARNFAIDEVFSRLGETPGG